MGFRIDRHKEPGTELHRIMLEQLDRAIDELSRTSPELRSKAVHSVRRRIKKVRTVLRLIRFSGNGRFSEVNHKFLREAGRSLASLRNTHVNRKTAVKLCKRSASDPERFAGILRLLDLKKKETGAEAIESMDKAATLLKSARTALESWNDGTIKRKDVLKGVKHIYKRSRAVFKKAAKDGSAEMLHECRKRTKDFRNALQLLRSMRLETSRECVAGADEFGALLGKDHDMAQLNRILETGDFETGRETLSKLIASSRCKLRKKIMKLGARLYCEKPKAFIAKFTD